MTDLQKKDLVINKLRILVRDLQMQILDLKRELPVDLSTRKKQFKQVIHNEKINDESA